MKNQSKKLYPHMSTKKNTQDGKLYIKQENAIYDPLFENRC